MPLYDKPVRLLLRDMVSDLGILPGTTIDKRSVIAWFLQKYPKVKEGTISAHLVRLSTNNMNRLHYSPRPNGEDDLFFQLDPNHFRLFDQLHDPTPIIKGSGGTPLAIMEDAEAFEEEANGPIATKSSQASEFAYERDLRNFLVKNLNLLETGIRLYEEEGITGVEFPAGGRFVDILAVDSNNNYVVIELKVSRGYDRVVGQLLRYMAWIEKHQADPGQSVRGVIIAKEISEDLLLACSKVHDVSLYEYELSIMLRRAA